MRNNKNRYELHRPHAGSLLHQILTKLSTSLLETMLLFYQLFSFFLRSLSHDVAVSRRGLLTFMFKLDGSRNISLKFDGICNLSL